MTNEGLYNSLSVSSVLRQVLGLRYVFVSHIPVRVIQVNKTKWRALQLYARYLEEYKFAEDVFDRCMHFPLYFVPRSQYCPLWMCASAAWSEQGWAIQNPREQLNRRELRRAVNWQHNTKVQSVRILNYLKFIKATHLVRSFNFLPSCSFCLLLCRIWMMS